VSSAGSQACAVAPGWPPCGSDITRNTASPAEVTPAEAQAAGTTSRRSHSRPMTNENTSSVTRIDCTTDNRPEYSASAWNTNAPTMAATPNSQSGLRIKYIAKRQPLSRAGAAVLATCCVTTFRAFVKAEANANRTLTMGVILGTPAEPSVETERAYDRAPLAAFRVCRGPCKEADPALTESAVRQSMSRLPSADASALEALTAERET
jgi:hypothetical protein